MKDVLPWVSCLFSFRASQSFTVLHFSVQNVVAPNAFFFFYIRQSENKALCLSLMVTGDFFNYLNNSLVPFFKKFISDWRIILYNVTSVPAVQQCEGALRIIYPLPREPPTPTRPLEAPPSSRLGSVSCSTFPPALVHSLGRVWLFATAWSQRAGFPVLRRLGELAQTRARRVSDASEPH